jgi:hypothetical protein
VRPAQPTALPFGPRSAILPRKLQLVEREADLRPEDAPKVNLKGIEELVTDKGYHSGAVVRRVKAYQVRSYIPEKQQAGRRNWKCKAEEQQAVYRNRQRVRSHYGKGLLRRRGELVERSFAHCYETGNMRRTHLRKHENILKRQLIHVGAFNLSLILRQMVGEGTPRELLKKELVLRLDSIVFRFWSMRGDERIQDGMFSYVSLERQGHPLRAIRGLTDVVLGL